MIFVSYSHEDGREALVEVQRQFGVLKEQSIELWSDERIKPGDDWRLQLREALSSSRLAVLIITPGFLQSQFVLNHEVPTILRRNQTGGMLVLPLYWTACHYKILPWLSEMQLIAANNESIGLLSYQERAKLLAKAVGECAQQLAETISVKIDDRLISLPRIIVSKRRVSNENPRGFIDFWFGAFKPPQARDPFSPIIAAARDNILDLRGLGLVRVPTNIPNFGEFDVIDLRDNEIESLPDLNKILSRKFKETLALRHKDYRVQLANIQRRSRGRRSKPEPAAQPNVAKPTEPNSGLYLAGNPFIDPLLRAAAEQNQPAATLDVLAYCRGDKKKLQDKFKIATPPVTMNSVRNAALAEAEEQGGELGLGPNKLHDLPDPKLLQQLADAKQKLVILVDRMIIQSLPGNSPPILRNTLGLYLEEISAQRPIPAMLDMYSNVILASVDDRDTREVLGGPLIKAFLEFDQAHPTYMRIYNRYQERDEILEACEIDLETTLISDFSSKFNEAASLFRSEMGRSVLTRAPQDFAEAVSALLTTSEHTTSALRERELRRWAVGGYATLSLLQAFLSDPIRASALTANKQDVEALGESLAEITLWFSGKIKLPEEEAG